MYVDSFVIAVPKDNVSKYKKMAAMMAKIYMQHGAVGYVETLEDDVPDGKVTDFRRAVQAKAGEVLVLGFAVFKTRKDRDRVSKLVHTDPRMGKMMKDGTPFDGKRMIYGGFKAFIDR